MPPIFEFDIAKSASNKEKHWVAFYTRRADAIRLISVRRARTKEVEYYESI
jgi:uncharacterized DUF497 family protein